MVHSISLKSSLFSFAFPGGSEIVDVDFFPEPDGKFGLLVAVNDEDASLGYTSYVVGLVQDGDTTLMKITASLAIPHKITVIKSLFNNEDMSTSEKRKDLRLHSKIEKWNHVIAVGTKNAHCYICHLVPQENSDSMDTVQAEARHLVDFMGSYLRTGKFIYEDGTGHSLRFPVASVSVTSLALLPRSRTLLVGLSMGGILGASLNPSNSIEPLEVRSDRMIRFLAPLEPEDDPDRHEYFLAATDGSPKHPIQFTLYRGAFKHDDNFLNSETRYDQPFFQCAFEHVIKFATNWISMKTLTSRRSEGCLTNNRMRKENGDITSDTSSILNASQAYGSSWIRSSVLLVYEKQSLVKANDFSMEASIFDIDSYYYKRMPGRVILDSTALRQCPFISNILSDVPSKEVQDVAILMDQREVNRFNSPICDADQLYYPSSISFNRVFVATPTTVSHMKICSLQETILESCAQKLPTYLRAPTAPSRHILAAGLVRESVLNGSPNSSMVSSPMMDIDGELSGEQKVILTAILYYGKVDAIVNLSKNAAIDNSLKREIVLWAFYECCDYRKMMLDRSLAIFSNAAVSLSPTANDALDLGVRLFFDVHELLVFYSRYLKDAALLSKYGTAIKCSLTHTILVRNFIENRVVPLNGITRCVMKEKHEAKKISAIRNRTALPIQINVRNLHRISPNEAFWDGLPHDQWYPPTPLNLLETILNTKIAQRVKREIIIQYVADWIRADSKSRDLNIDDVAKQVFSNLHDTPLGVTKEHVAHYLEQEQSAVKQNPQTSVFEQDERSSKYEMEDLTYEQLWDGKVRMTERLTDKDKHRFEQRYLAQKEKNGRKLPTLDPFDEKMYQLYLYNRERFSFMSQEAIKSNKLLTALKPHLVNTVTEKMAELKTDKEKEIENAVRAMFDKNKKLSSESVIQPKSIFATMSSQKPPEPILVQKEARKRPSMGIADGADTSPQYVPPVPKRALQDANSPTKMPQSATSPPVSQNDTDDELIHAAIRTPARYLKQTTNVVVPDDELSPVNRPLPPTATCPNSILKTAKAVQSPSRGRIRFHETVPVPDDESLQEGSRIRGALNFDEEDEEDEEAPKSPEFASDAENVEDTDDCVEMEKSYENQKEQEEEEEFDVYQDASSGEDKVANEAEKMDETFEIPQDIEERLDRIESSGEEEPMEEEKGEMIEKSFEVQKDEDVEPVGEESPQEPVAEVAIEHTQEKAEEAQVEGAEEIEPEKTVEVAEDVEKPEEIATEMQEETEEMQVSMEVQEDEVPIRSTRERTTSRTEPEVEEDTNVAEKTTRRSTRSRTTSRTTPDIETSAEVQLDIEAPVESKSEETKTKRSTRSRTTSRTTPDIETSAEVQLDIEAPVESKSEETKTRRSTRARTPSRTTPEIETSAEVQHDAEAPAETKTRRSTRARTPSRTDVQEDQPKTRRSMRVRTPSRSEVSPQLEIEPSPNTTGLARRLNSRTQRESSVQARSRQNSVSTPSTSKRGRASSKTEKNEQEEQSTPAKRTRSTSRSRKTSEEPPKTPKSTRRGAPKVLDAIDEEQSGEKPVTPRRGRQPKAVVAEAQPAATKLNWRERFAKSLEKNVGPEAAAIVRKTRSRSSSTTATSPSKTSVAKLEKVEEVEEEPKSAKRGRARTSSRTEKTPQRGIVEEMETMDEVREPVTPRRSARRLARP